MRESAIEDRLRAWAAKRGGMALKLAPTRAGMPDRLLLLPGGRAVLIEMKTADGRLSAVQRLFHAQLARIGHPVSVVYGPGGLAAIIRELEDPACAIVGGEYR